MAKKIIIVNGSPRNNQNTAQMLKKAAQGAQEAGAETKLVNLRDLQFHGCYSCFACKRLGAPTFGRCTYNDELKPILKEIHEEASGLLIGFPIYFGAASSDTAALMERLLFPYFDYSPEMKSLFNRKIPVGLIATMGAPQPGYFDKLLKDMQSWLSRTFGSCEVITAADTWQFPDYSKYASSMFDPDHKKLLHHTQFPKDLLAASELGRRIASK